LAELINKLQQQFDTHRLRSLPSSGKSDILGDESLDCQGLRGSALHRRCGGFGMYLVEPQRP